jgi:hypothetical protein
VGQNGGPGPGCGLGARLSHASTSWADSTSWAASTAGPNGQKRFFFSDFFKSELVKQKKYSAENSELYFSSYRKFQRYLWTILFRCVLWYFYLYFMQFFQLIMKPTWINYCLNCIEFRKICGD